MNRSTTDIVSSGPRVSPLIQVAPAALLAIRDTLLTRADLDTVTVLRDAGFAGGEQLYAAFRAYIWDQLQLDPNELEITEFFVQAGEFFTACGWGETTLSAQDDTFCVITIDNCWETGAASVDGVNGCHFTVGFLAAFLGQFADYPLSVLETVHPSDDSSRCTFIAGNVEMVNEYYTQHA